MGLLHSIEGLQGFSLSATDGELGHVKDVYFDDSEWAVRYLAVDTRNWWPGKKVMIPPGLIERVSWEGKSVVVKVTREQIENSTEYDPDRPLVHHGGSDVYRSFGAQR